MTQPVTTPPLAKLLQLLRVKITHCRQCPFAHLYLNSGDMRYCWLDRAGEKRDVTNYTRDKTRPPWCRLNALAHVRVESTYPEDTPSR